MCDEIVSLRSSLKTTVIVFQLQVVCFHLSVNRCTYFCQYMYIDPDNQILWSKALTFYRQTIPHTTYDTSFRLCKRLWYQQQSFSGLQVPTFSPGHTCTPHAQPIMHVIIIVSIQITHGSVPPCKFSLFLVNCNLFLLFSLQLKKWITSQTDSVLVLEDL